MSEVPGRQVVKWADSAMFTSEAHSSTHEGPKVHLLDMNTDPLGSVAACAKMYLGEVVRSLAEITDEERRHYLHEIQQTKLKMPLEAVSLHFMLENVTRGFTHQLVRQRTAAYAQESMRFAVVEDMTQAVALPPSLARYNDQELAEEALERKRSDARYAAFGGPKDETERRFWVWTDAVERVGRAYTNLVEAGMPAEDARGLMPTNIVTRVHYITNLRGLLDHAGNRLCTQAQFEWRLVFMGIAKAIATYDPRRANAIRLNGEDPDKWEMPLPDRWQFEAIAALLRPVCYQTRQCAFLADFDRKCSIRHRVELNHKHDRDPNEWDTEDHIAGIGAIHPAEWLLNPEAAR